MRSEAYGGKASTTRSPQQTGEPPDSGSWLVRRPITRTAPDRPGKTVERHRQRALHGSFAVALTNAYIAVFDAKYRYEFWRPITAIRNADIDGNPDTDIEVTWQPIDNTPMHPDIRVHTASRAVRLRASWKRCSAPRTFPKSR